MGMKLSIFSITSGPDFSDISIVIVIAPGPAIRGIASGKVANDNTDISSFAVSAKFCLLSSRFSKTISKATTTRNRPPIILNELIFTPIISSKAPPIKEKNSKIKKDINVALR